MAVMPELQGQGLGAAVLEYALSCVANAGGGLVWANIREPKIGFYEKWGFAIADDVYVVRSGGTPHRYGEIVIPSKTTQTEGRIPVPDSAVGVNPL